MDFRQNLQQAMGNRTDQQPVEPGQAPKSGTPEKKAFRVFSSPKWLTVLSTVVLVGMVLLVIASIFAFTQIGKNTVSESKYVDTSVYQAVFLNNGQVYFGNVNVLNSKFIKLTNVYYLTQSSTATTSTASTSSSDYTLVKLGCQQIHYPTDQMVINRDQVTFWENLNKDGKVAKSIVQFKQQYPNGDNCTTSNSTTSNPQSTTNPTGTGTTTNTTTTTNKQ